MYEISAFYIVFNYKRIQKYFYKRASIKATLEIAKMELFRGKRPSKNAKALENTTFWRFDKCI